MKIAFIVQPDWLNVHFGVRNFAISCFKVLERGGHDVQFVRFEQNYKELMFYREVVADADLKSRVKQTTIGTRKPYKDLTQDRGSPLAIYTQFLGNDIADDYDAFILTNPWLVTYPLNFKKKPVSLICHDCGANTLNCLNIIDAFDWGFAHNVGYLFAKNRDYHFLSNSAKTDREIVDFYKPGKHSFLSPLPTYAFFDVSYSKKQKKENAVVLAAPFDPRKGLLNMPSILNRLQDDIDTLYIYGTPRCGKGLYDDFYKKIKVKNIVHYDKITSEDLIELYKRSKLLFFPSREEGLGIPLMEAQLCGCRVATTNNAPMNQLLCSGGYLLTGDFETDVLNIMDILNDNKFDYYDLSIQAKEKFSTEKIYGEIMKSIK